MSKNWWYVEGKDRKGPVEESDLKDLLETGTLNSDSYIWTKGFENWVKFNEVGELVHLLRDDSPAPVELGTILEEETDSESEDDWNIESQEEATAREPAVIGSSSLDLHGIGDLERVFYIKTGMDRNSKESGAEYGPFSLEQLERLFSENRINEKTFIFTTGMENWCLLAEFELFPKISGGMEVEIEEHEKRQHTRKPFVANMYFHDQSKLYEGVCRDISIGGMQVLVSNFPGEINDEVTMNVHPENSDHGFVASGKIVRILDGNSGFSLRFKDIGEDALKAINNYIESN